jgi:hypothetical protein
MLLFTFGFPHKKEKKIKKKRLLEENQKNIYIIEKKTHEHLENAQGLFEEVQKIQRLKLDGIFLTNEVLIDKKTSI